MKRISDAWRRQAINDRDVDRLNDGLEEQQPVETLSAAVERLLNWITLIAVLAGLAGAVVLCKLLMRAAVVSQEGGYIGP
jgi:hypothetical protein